MRFAFLPCNLFACNQPQYFFSSTKSIRVFLRRLELCFPFEESTHYHQHLPTQYIRQIQHIETVTGVILLLWSLSLLLKPLNFVLKAQISNFNFHYFFLPTKNSENFRGVFFFFFFQKKILKNVEKIFYVEFCCPWSSDEKI